MLVMDDEDDEEEPTSDEVRPTLLHALRSLLADILAHSRPLLAVIGRGVCRAQELAQEVDRRTQVGRRRRQHADGPQAHRRSGLDVEQRGQAQAAGGGGGQEVKAGGAGRERARWVRDGG